ncbi:Universal stress protein Slr1101 [Clonorchis sinensis]|uniref:Universal stress protein Slr1101 n=2 Tax=Clonorchis sinensis TaxID=79923 RepID=A0A8T1MPS7_CLOSI|nr:Universal stress protein Slr1101 [Clonorchis sinensis]GAA36495.1 universal stress protein [Clonorchis sinensis]
MAQPANQEVSQQSDETKSRVILFPVDGSSHSERAFAWYVDNMKQDTDTVKFVSVIEPVYTTPAIGMAMESPPLPDMARVMEESIQAGKRLCQQCMHKAKAANVCCQAFLHVDSNPGQAIVKSIGEHKADLVIMGNRGAGLLRRTFLGSVSDYVLHHSHVAVIIVPPPAPEAK